MQRLPETARLVLGPGGSSPARGVCVWGAAFQLSSPEPHTHPAVTANALLAICPPELATC